MNRQLKKSMSRARMLLKNLIVLTAWVPILFIFPSNGPASIISIQLDYDLFGHVKNTAIGQCAATSVINSYKYLTQKYPLVYGGTNLLPGAGKNIVDARDKLDGGWTHNGKKRNGMGASTGTLSHKNVWESKVFWVQDFAPGTTYFDGMYWKPGEDLSKWYHGWVLENAFPTWDFLWTELSHGEDVEIAFDKPGTKLGHQITLTSLKFNDANDDGIWTSGETRWIDYLDPNNPTKLIEAKLEFNETHKYYSFDWDNGVNSKVEDVRIYSALSESPVPEPRAILLFGIGLLVLAGTSRNLQNKP